jgi:hypothetical protein
MSPTKRSNQLRQTFDSSFRKETWVINPTIIPFLTPFEVREAKQNEDQTVTHGLLPLIAPVNHNKLTRAKMYRILHTILGNPYQYENKMARANKDFGNDASIIVGFHDDTLPKENTTVNRAYMHCLHPDDDQNRECVFRTLFPPIENDLLKDTITSEAFKKLLKTDATTIEGQYVAEYFQMTDSVDFTSGSKNTFQIYHKLLLDIKERKSKQYCVWISFWEGMHRHSAIIMALLAANVSHNTNKCYIPGTLEKFDFYNRGIKGFNDKIGNSSDSIIKSVFKQRENRPKMIQTEMTVNVYVPIDRTVKIIELTRSMTEQSRHVSENKLNSAKRTVSTVLADWHHKCSPDKVTNVPSNKEPIIHDIFKLHISLSPRKYDEICEELIAEGLSEEEWETEFKWFPKFISSKNWANYVKNPFHQDNPLVFDLIDINEQEARPPYRITLKSITQCFQKDNFRYIGKKQINFYHIIPGIMYELIS